jgi:hypothetical protein
MVEPHRVGDLVHIPQCVSLIDCGGEEDGDPQLTIPLRVQETTEPSIGVITRASEHGYVRVFCNGTSWSVKHGSIYTLEKR